MIGHQFRAVKDKHGRGYYGQFTYSKGGVDCTGYVRDADGLVVIFGNKQAASWSASRALCKALNEDHRAARGREVRVTHSGGKPHLTDLIKHTFGAVA